jgi:ATP-dependent RNA helicase DeaD
VESYVHRIGRTGRAGREGTAITLIQPVDRRKLRLIERHVRQNLTVRNIPTRAQIEARQLEKMQGKVREALAGERMASFLPLVSQLSEEYDSHAIAAAALQMAFDQSRPAWMDADYAQQEDAPIAENGVKPILIKKRTKNGTGPSNTLSPTFSGASNSPVPQNY